MSWFNDQIIDLDHVDHDDDERPGEEIAEGVLVERRDVIRMSLGAMAALSLGWPQRLLACEEGEKKLSAEGDLAWDMLIKKAVPMAEALVKSKKPDEEAYLKQVIALIQKLDKVPKARFRGKRKIETFSHYRKQPFVVVQFKLKPGAIIPYHDHRDYNGILSCVAGDARVKSFNIQGEIKTPPKGKTFQIQESGNLVLKPGQQSHLSRTQHNIHDVRAGKEGARLLDFFTFFEKHGKSVYLNVEKKARDEKNKIYDASWK